MRFIARFAAFLVLLSSFALAGIADGVGVFPVLVQVQDEQGDVVLDARVRLLDSDKKGAASAITDEHARRRVNALLETPVTVDSLGSAVVYYYGGWSRIGTGNRAVYSRQVRGRIVVEAAGYAPAEQPLAKKGASRSGDYWDSTPTLHVTLTPKPLPADFLSTTDPELRSRLDTLLTFEFRGATLAGITEWLEMKTGLKFVLPEAPAAAATSPASPAPESEEPPLQYTTRFTENVPAIRILFRACERFGVDAHWRMGADGILFKRRSEIAVHLSLRQRLIGIFRLTTARAAFEYEDEYEYEHDSGGACAPLLLREAPY